MKSLQLRGQTPQYVLYRQPMTGVIRVWPPAPRVPVRVGPAAAGPQVLAPVRLAPGGTVLRTALVAPAADGPRPALADELGATVRAPGTVAAISGLWTAVASVAAPAGQALLPAAAGLPQGALLAVRDGAWAVTTAAGWAAVGTLPGGDPFPDPAGLPDGAMVTVRDGVWMVETAGGWVPTTGRPSAAAWPAVGDAPAGALLQVIDNQWVPT